MFTFVYTKLLFTLFRRAKMVHARLLYVCTYSYLLRLEPDQKRGASAKAALELTKIMFDVSQLLRLVSQGGDGEDERRLRRLIDNDAVVDAMSRTYTTHKMFCEWAMLEDSAEPITQLDEAFRVLGTSPLAKSPRDLPYLIRDAKKRLKSAQSELAASEREEANNEVYAVLFPKRLSLSELLQFFGFISSAYIVGAYLFALVVFKRLESQVVGLQHFDYLQFATVHVLWVLPFLLIGALLALPENFDRARSDYLATEYGVMSKRYTKFDIALYLALAGLNIPVFQKLLGMDVEGWAQIVLLDGALLMLFAVKQIPFERLFDHWYMTQLAVLSALMLMAQMALVGWKVAEDLKEPSSTEWQYRFGDMTISSDEYSFVYEGEAYVVFYERSSGKMLVKDSAAVKSFVGNL